MKKTKLALMLVGVLCANIFLSTEVFCSDIEVTDNLMLVNKQHAIASEYGPKGQTDMAGLIPMNKDHIIIGEETSKALLAMNEALKAQGMNDLVLVSGYRSYSYQKMLYNNQIAQFRGVSKQEAERLAAQIVTPMGTSEHQTGMAVDVSTYGLIKAGDALTQDFENTQVGQWLDKNSTEFGFILRYQQDKMNITDIIFEPWHFRYVGKPHAKIITSLNMCLEEYLEFLKLQKAYAYEDGSGKSYGIYYVEDISNLNYDKVQEISNDGKGGYIVTTYGDTEQINKDVENYKNPKIFTDFKTFRQVLVYISIFKTIELSI
jgi:D-alanyl-D-alanine carboxypeptidase